MVRVSVFANNNWWYRLYRRLDGKAGIGVMVEFYPDKHNGEIVEKTFVYGNTHLVTGKPVVVTDLVSDPSDYNVLIWVIEKLHDRLSPIGDVLDTIHRLLGDSNRDKIRAFHRYH